MQSDITFQSQNPYQGPSLSGRSIYRLCQRVRHPAWPSPPTENNHMILSTNPGCPP
jgi:hypothetical protein